MKKILILLSILSFLLISCDPENPNNPNDQEVITSLQIRAESATDTVVFAYSDPDGVGGIVPTIDTIVLLSATTYSVSLELLDETKTPEDTVTHEILAEAEAHQFFFTITGANFTSAYNDTDSNGKPIGLLNSWVTGSVSTGTIMVSLRHQPDKNGIGVSAGNITNAGGETDIEITFPVRIE
jgi:hypothetical protein